MLDLVIASGGDRAWLVEGTVSSLGVEYLSFVPGLVAYLAGVPAIWGPLQKWLGTHGAWRKIPGLAGRGRPAQQQDQQQDEPIDQARVLVGLAVLGVVMMLPPIGWLVVAPGFWPVMVLAINGRTWTGWARNPHNLFAGGSATATLINSGKGFAVMAGVRLSDRTLSAPAQAATSAAEADAAPEVVQALAQVAFTNLAVLTVVLVVINIGWALSAARLRVAPWAELDAPLRALDPERGPAILAALRDAGFGDIGSITAVFLDHPRAVGAGLRHARFGIGPLATTLMDLPLVRGLLRWADRKAVAAQQRRRDTVLIKDGVTDGRDNLRKLNDHELDTLRPHRPA
jgi:hypothetical protein